MHEDATYEDAVVYVSGHAYKRCAFERCTFVVKGNIPCHFESCSFGGIVWHIDVLVHDKQEAANLIQLLEVVSGSIPQERPNTDSPGGSQPPAAGGAMEQ